MLKISKKYFLAFYISIIIIVTAIIFFKERVNYNDFLIYLILLPLFFYIENDLKIEKRDLFYIIGFVITLASISAAQYVFSLNNLNYLSYAIILVLSAMVFYIISFFVNKKENIIKKEFYVNHEILGVIILFILAFIMRIYRINDIPPGVWFDEAQNGNELITLMGSDNLPVFIPRLTQMPALYFYFAAFLSKIFGINIFSLRLVSILLGSFSIVAFYFLLRYIFKDYRIAFAASLMMATSEWHINFSRVAFLGMQTIFIEIIFFYFYLKMTQENKIANAAMAGIAMGISLYTFSAAYFIPFIVILYSIYLMFKDKNVFIKIYLRNFLFMATLAFIIVIPLLNYAKNNYLEFTQRARDVSITNDIAKSKSIAPVISNVEKHFLMFNYEGDYNGRHNLSKSPMLDNVSGVLLIAGFLIALFNTQYYLYLFWFLVMLLPGIMTVSIEAPQAYRTIAIIPAIYILIAVALINIKNMLQKLNKNNFYLSIVLAAIVIMAAVLNIYRYFFLYGTASSTYISFSPEANEISQSINAHIDNYYIFLSPARNMYSFYSAEQQVITNFLTYGKGTFYMLGDNIKEINKNEYIGKKGLLFIIRPTDILYETSIRKKYPDAIREDHKNPYTGEINFICYYINNESKVNAK